MVKTSHNKTIRINAAGNYQINSSNEFIIIDTTDVVTLYLPHMLKDNDRINVISVVAAPYIRLAYGNSGLYDLTTDYGYLQFEYNSSADSYVFRELVAPAGGGGDNGWTLEASVTRLNSDLGISVDSINPIASNVDYLSVIDTSVSDVTTDITSLESANIIKNIKVSGPYDLILQSTAGFSDGTNELIVTDSAILFHDVLAGKWQIVYNNEWKTKVVDISSAEILDLTTPVEILPLAGAGKYYDFSAYLKYTFETTPYSLNGLSFLTFQQGTYQKYVDPNLIVESQNAVAEIYAGSTGNISLNQNVTFFGDVNPTLGDGTLQAIIKYRVLTF